MALMRLQDTYNLETSSIARGELNGVQYRYPNSSHTSVREFFFFLNLKFFPSTEMTANDCFEMGRQSYLNKDYYHTALWMREAMDRLTSDTNQTTGTSKADILEYLAFSVYKQGKYYQLKFIHFALSLSLTHINTFTMVGL